LKIDCSWRKPKPGLLLQAIDEMNIALASSWMIGDGITDIQAGKAGGCKTILIGRMKCEICQIMHELNAKPNAVKLNLSEVAVFIL